MIGLKLYCEPGKEHHELLNFSAVLWERLALVTVEALGTYRESGVDLRIIPSASWNSTGLELVAEVSRGKTPKQDMTKWKDALMAEWNLIRNDERFLSIRKILRKSIGFSTRIVDADYDELPADITG